MFKHILTVLLLVRAAYCVEPVEPFIVNGTNADISQYPYVVSLRGSSGSHSCGASIIRNRWILTAAHCVQGKTARSLSIQYGVTRIARGGPNIAAVQRVIIHENYAPANNFAHDIALLQLRNPLRLSRNVAIIRLPQRGSQVPANRAGILVGWGLDKTGGSIQTHLKQARLKIYSDAECRRRHNGKTTVNNICAGVDEGGKGQCSGDSGGPLNYNGLQVGVVSWSEKPCTIKPYPGVYTKVSHYIDWINSKLR